MQTFLLVAPLLLFGVFKASIAVAEWRYKAMVSGLGQWTSSESFVARDIQLAQWGARRSPRSQV